ncbi:MAG: hypothetical protein DRJ30_06180 [Candidatus Methanomethylicota archaeon]|nr:MAG: hypothetical protein DRJ30_06180 [Candidatus Verstraetearchaeota archaeon]
MNKIEERRILLRRLFYRDRDIYKLGKLAGLAWFNRFKAKFERDRYAYFADEERKEAIEKIVSELSDDKFVEVVNKVFSEERRYIAIDRFVGEHYYFDVSVGLHLDNRQDKLREEIWNALKETKGRSYYFLKAIIELYKEGKWDRAYGGATWVDILAKIRELGGVYPPPRDIALLKSYRIYYKTGSRRYPTHTVPEEIIPVVEEVLEQYSKEKLRGAVQP